MPKSEDLKLALSANCMDKEVIELHSAIMRNRYIFLRKHNFMPNTLLLSVNDNFLILRHSNTHTNEIEFKKYLGMVVYECINLKPGEVKAGFTY